ncbi:MAG TPA: tRNA pseudouridine(38-40) synthase TruA [Firmicutes bacterium]|nr:tRNA pseudouridine(38-40) synthase TruA [Bacillota bacterium]
MKNYMLTFAFDGTNYYGTQKQKNLPTVQQVFEDVLSSIYDEKIKFSCCSRLDRNVHGLYMGGNYKVSSEKVKENKLVYVLNRLLPKDIRVYETKEVYEDFSCRYDAIKKTYLYRIDISSIPSPFKANYTFHPIFKVDIKKLNHIKDIFLGTHDFYSFSSEDDEKENTVLTVDNISIKNTEDEIEIRISGRKFLRYQVRYIVASMLEYAWGKVEENDIIERLSTHIREKKRYKVPAQGLYLESVEYDFERSKDAKV